MNNGPHDPGDEGDGWASEEEEYNRRQERELAAAERRRLQAEAEGNANRPAAEPERPQMLQMPFEERDATRFAEPLAGDRARALAFVNLMLQEFNTPAANLYQNRLRDILRRHNVDIQRGGDVTPVNFRIRFNVVPELSTELENLRNDFHQHIIAERQRIQHANEQREIQYEQRLAQLEAQRREREERERLRREQAPVSDEQRQRRQEEERQQQALAAAELRQAIAAGRSHHIPDDADLEAAQARAAAERQRLEALRQRVAAEREQAERQRAQAAERQQEETRLDETRGTTPPIAPPNMPTQQTTIQDLVARINALENIVCRQFLARIEVGGRPTEATSIAVNQNDRPTRAEINSFTALENILDALRITHHAQPNQQIAPNEHLITIDMDALHEHLDLINQSLPHIINIITTLRNLRETRPNLLNNMNLRRQGNQLEYVITFNDVSEKTFLMRENAPTVDLEEISFGLEDLAGYLQGAYLSSLPPPPLEGAPGPSRRDETTTLGAASTPGPASTTRSAAPRGMPPARTRSITGITQPPPMPAPPPDPVLHPAGNRVLPPPPANLPPLPPNLRPLPAPSPANLPPPPADLQPIPGTGTTPPANLPPPPAVLTPTPGTGATPPARPTTPPPARPTTPPARPTTRPPPPPPRSAKPAVQMTEAEKQAHLLQVHKAAVARRNNPPVPAPATTTKPNPASSGNTLTDAEKNRLQLEKHKQKRR